MIGARVAQTAPVGSLLKGASPAKPKKKDMGRSPRVRNEAHLEAIRQCPCVRCGHDPASEAAHIRISHAGRHKQPAGIGAKPDDAWTAPLCHACHMHQHQVGELTFWAEAGIDPLRLAETLYRLAPNVEAMRAASFAAHAISGA